MTVVKGRAGMIDAFSSVFRRHFLSISSWPNPVRLEMIRGRRLKNEICPQRTCRPFWKVRSQFRRKADSEGQKLSRWKTMDPLDDRSDFEGKV